MHLLRARMTSAIKDFGSNPWHGPFTAAGTPEPIVNQLQAKVATPEKFAAMIKDDLPKWAMIVRESGATVD